MGSSGNGGGNRVSSDVGGVGVRSAAEKEKTKMRERQRRSITTKIFHGLRKHGGYRLSPRADINEVLRHLAREAGWVVDPDGTTYRSPAPLLVRLFVLSPKKLLPGVLISLLSSANFISSSSSFLLFSTACLFRFPGAEPLPTVRRRRKKKPNADADQQRGQRFRRGRFFHRLFVLLRGLVGMRQPPRTIHARKHRRWRPTPVTGRSKRRRSFSCGVRWKTASSRLLAGGEGVESEHPCGFTEKRAVKTRR